MQIYNSSNVSFGIKISEPLAAKIATKAESMPKNSLKSINRDLTNKETLLSNLGFDIFQVGISPTARPKDKFCLVLQKAGTKSGAEILLSSPTSEQKLIPRYLALKESSLKDAIIKLDKIFSDKRLGC